MTANCRLASDLRAASLPETLWIAADEAINTLAANFGFNSCQVYARELEYGPKLDSV
jgi:hypothetical protein